MRIFSAHKRYFFPSPADFACISIKSPDGRRACYVFFRKMRPKRFLGPIFIGYLRGFARLARAWKAGRAGVGAVEVLRISLSRLGPPWRIKGNFFVDFCFRGYTLQPLIKLFP